MTIAIKHATLVNGAVPDSTDPADFIKMSHWDEAHNLTQDASGILGRTSGSGDTQILTPTQVKNYLGVVASVTPYQYGAVGDGATDDTAALQAALDYCATSGYSLYLGVGRFRISSPLSITTGMRVHGDGWSDSQIWVAAHVNCFNINATEAVLLEKFKILGPNDGSASTATGGTAITVTGSPVNNSTTLRDLRIIFCYNYVSFANAQVWTIDNCYMLGCPSGGTGITIQNTYIAGNGELQISNSLIQGGDALTSWGTTGIAHGSGVNLKIVNSELFGWTYGYKLALTSADPMAGTYFDNCVFSQVETAIRLNKGTGTAYNMVTVSGGQIYARHCIAADTNDGWLSDVTIFGVTMGAGEGDPVSSATGTAISLPACNSFTIGGNIIYGTAGCGSIVIGADSENGSVFFNQLRGAIDSPAISSTTTAVVHYEDDVMSFRGASSYDFDAPVRTINLGLKMLDTGGDHYRTVSFPENLTADRDVYMLFGDVSRTVDFTGTTANVRANTSGKLANVDRFWDAMVPVTITYASSVAPDFSTFIHGDITLTGALTLANPTNTKNGQSGSIRLIQDATGSRTISFGTNWKFAGGTAPTLTTTANAIDILHYTVYASGVVRASLEKDVK